jgi:hypothetical protein
VAFGFHRCQPWPKFFSRLRGWYGVGAPKATPTEIVDKLNKEINAGLADPKIKARFADLGGAPGLAADFGKLIAEEIEKWGNVVKFTSRTDGLHNLPFSEIAAGSVNARSS